MTFITVLVVIVIASFIGFRKVAYPNGLSLLLGLSLLFSSCTLFTAVLICAVNRSSERDSLVRFESFRTTISSVRSEKLSDIERAAILKEIVDWNEWIASVKYWNKTAWDIFHIDEVEDLEPLK